MITVDYTIPLYSIIIGCGSMCIGGIWFGIKFYFKNKDMETKQHEQDAEIKTLYKRLDDVKDGFELKLKNHVEETNENFDKINRKLDNQNTTMTEVKTMVKLLVENKIK